MNEERDFAAEGRAIVDASLYMVLGTADPAGRPWVSPVYYAHTDYREFLWVSKPGARHSRNLEARDAVSIVIFDSTVPINSGRAVYVSATARRLDGDGAAAALAVFSRRGVAHGGREFSAGDVEPPAHRRLYAATALDTFVLDENDERVPVAL